MTGEARIKMMYYSVGTPTEMGVYACRVRLGNGGVLGVLSPVDDLFLSWNTKDQQWYFIGSDQKFPYPVIGWIGPLQRQFTCRACRYCGIEPQDMEFTCGHPGAGPYGQHIREEPLEFCGWTKFEQHPGRTPRGTLKDRAESLVKGSR